MYTSICIVYPLDSKKRSKTRVKSSVFNPGLWIAILDQLDSCQT